MRGLLRALSAIGAALLISGLAVAPAASAHPEGLHVLLFSKTAAGAYRHDSIPAGITMFEQLAAEKSWELTKSEDSAVFNDAGLANYDVIVMLQTSGMVWDTAAQRTALQTYVRNGGGVVAIHNATDMNIESQFPWWDQFLGMTMTAHSAIVTGTAKVADRLHPSGAPLPDRWVKSEEWYNFNRSGRGDVHVLVTADETTYNAGSAAMGHDHPISWCRNYEGGRLWATGMGHQSADYSNALFKGHVSGGVESAGGKVAADCGPTVWGSYEKVSLDETTIAPGALDIAPDGRVFFTEYGGKLRIFKPDTRTTVTAATLNVYGGGEISEDGLTGVALDPDFATNKWIYLMYSPGGTTAEVARVSRFTMNGDVLDTATEKVLLTVPMWRTNEPGHTGGYLTFGPNKNLYIGVGDDVNPFASDGYTPIDERAGRQWWDAQGTSANTNDLRGKILRIHPEIDGTYTVPSGNMFAPGTAKTKPEIYAMGFRNPFRFSVHPTTGAIYVADYGPDAGADNAGRGPGGLVEWNIVKSPGNYGWPYCIGNNTPFNDYNFATGTSGAKFNCASPTNTSPNNTGLTTLPAAKAADIWYGNSATEGNKFPEFGSGGEAPMAFPIYKYDPANTSPTKFPAYFDGTPFFGEWARNSMFELRPDSNGNLLKANRFLSNMTFDSPMDMKFGRDGSMYLLTWGQGWDDNVHLPGSGLFRIDYNGGERSPVAVAAATPTSGGVPLTVQFSSAGSKDPEGGALTYKWTFGDGTSSTAANPSKVYNTRGVFAVQLTVTDPTGKTGTANLTVTAGNTAPTVRFTGPADGGMFEWGDTVPYTVSVTDPEDGTVNCSRVVTQANIGHDSHKHPLGSPMNGCSGSMVATADVEHQNGNAHIIGSTEYTDNGATGVPALTGSASVVLQPKRKQAEFFNGSSGVRVVSQSGAESGARIGDISNNDWISFKPVNFTGINQVSLRVSSPSGGGSVELRAGSVTGPLVASVPVPSTGGWDNYVSLPAVNITRPAGSTELFVVFKTPSNHNYDLDSIRYIGPGVGTAGPPPAKQIIGVGGKCVDVNNNGSVDGSKIQLWTCNGGNNQKWTQTGTTLQSLGKCMTAVGNSQTDGTLIQLFGCNGATGQNWSVQSDGTIRNGTKCLDATGGASADGTQLIIWTCNGGTNQKWSLS
ncbi:PKD domain-containing protein [Actinokineospora alba]|uniref:PKD domain-containing protein n=1 Tax=Actinokineospora alba TaxID=504798 RepID=A0A1H0NMC0_9PSEU|nr:ThuA domain-containing protein [Actinokineospora alba]TDP68773.1 PKD domain-containing protein [Actinokineospora alba]SDH86351.1 PKD domain-containing protein [Actinokineospora alba]SDO93897.1 PKD domain-containing protein [Actinokineospora alba]